MIDIVMPKAGIDMQEGKVVRWLKKEGDPVKKGEVIAEIETDKVTIEEESPANGFMLQIIAKEGDTIPVTEVIAWIGKEGEVPPAIISNKKEEKQLDKIEISNKIDDTAMVPAPIKGLIDIVMPKAGIDMQEGKIVRWLKKDGDPVKKGEPIAEIETDKVTIEEESPIDGIFLKSVAPEGVSIPVVQIIAYIGKVGAVMPAEIPMVADPNAVKTDKPKAIVVEQNVVTSKVASGVARDVNAPILATPYARLLASEKGIDLSNVVGSGENGVIKADDVLNAKTKATGLAKAVACQKGINLSDISGTGFNGKILSRDVLSDILGTEVKPAREQKVVAMSGMRKVIAKRMAKSASEIPTVTNTIPVDVTDLMELRRQINGMDGVKVSVNDFVIGAVAKALDKCPYINVSIDGDSVVYHANINIGMAVGTEEALIVPVIKDADNMHLFEISAKAKDYGTRGKSGKISLDELSGGTFTISNIGMFGITHFTPIINQPEAAILGVCAIEDMIKRIDGQIVDRKIMNLCLTFDHRVIDGVKASIFLNEIKINLQNPAQLLF